LNSIQQMIVYSLLTGAKIDIGEIIFNELVTRLTDKPRKKCVAYPMFLSCVLENLLGSEYTQDKALGSIPSVLRVPPKVTKGKKQSKTKKTSLIQSTLKFTNKKEPSKATDTSQSVSSGQSSDPQDTKGNKQPAVKGLPSTQPKDGTRKSKLLPEGNTPNP
ncbi:hypothetical protein Tco_0913582, partial [Tanacetum coccineum]